jgi:hypothetical protein
MYRISVPLCFTLILKACRTVKTGVTLFESMITVLEPLASNHGKVGRIAS